MIHILIAIIIATAEGLGDYELILRHKDTRQGYFARDILTTGVENVNNPEANTYSIIGNINPNDYLDKDGYYRLKTIYGNVDGSTTILEWKQTSWITADTTTGFVPINIPPETAVAGCTHCLFQGLSSGNDVGNDVVNDATYLDGNDDHAHTQNSIGRVSNWGNGQMPAFNGGGAYSCALYIFGTKSEPGIGCANAESEIEVVSSNIYACPGTFAGGIFSDEAQGLCTEGYAICVNADNAAERGLTDTICRDYTTIFTDPNQFFGTQETSAGGWNCYSNSKHIYDPTSTEPCNDIWGCGQLAHEHDRACSDSNSDIIFRAAIGNGNIGNWILQDGGALEETHYEAIFYDLTDAASGGVLCCNTYETIECARDTTTFDWDELTKDGIEMNPQIDIIEWNINVDETAQTDLTLNIEVRVPYVVRASADDQTSANFGTTYVLDFEDFDAHKSSITQPNTCSNRLESDYIGKTTTSSRFEILSDSLDAIGTNNNMCYPATDGSGWEIIKDDDCNSILYKGKWTWGELRECRNNDGALTDAGVQQTSVDNTDPNYLQLFGTFYVNMISPFWYEDYANKDKNLDFYRVYQLISQPFVIQISKSVYVIGSTGINVMTMSIIAVYKEDQDEDYILILLTEAAEYMELINGQIINVPQSTQFKLAMQSTSESTGCLNNKAYLCSQLWKIYTTEQTCDTDRDALTNPTGGIDFSGDYQLRFTPQCRQNVDETHCLDWLEAHPIYKNDNDDNNNVQNGVILSSHLTFVDGICEAKTFTIQLEATMNFYENADYTGYIDPESSPHLYQVGKDTVYGEIKLVFPTATENIFDSELINVWLCTFPPDTNPLPPDQNGPDINKAAHDATNGGCFSNLRDGFTNGEGDEFFFHVYGENIAEEDFIVNQNGNEGNDVIQFQFTVPHEIQRDTLYVHAQVEVLLEELPRRRLLLDIKTKPRGATTNKIAHFGQNIGITNQPKQAPPPQEPISPISPIQQPPASQPFTISLNSTWVIIIGALLSIILLFNIILMCYMNCCKSNNGRPKISFSKNRRNGYDSVKHIDSEQFDDSEANLINVN